MNASSSTSRTSLLALAVAGALTCTSALASNMGWPSSVNESAPSVQAYSSGPVQEPLSVKEPELRMSDPLATGASNTDAPPLYVVEVTEYWMIGSDSHPSEPAPEVGSTSSSGGGTVGFDSTSSVDSTSDAMSTSSAASSLRELPHEIVVYTPTADTLARALGENTLLVSEHYLIPAPLSSFDGSGFLVLGIGPTEQDMALLDSLKDVFIVVTPAVGG